MQAVICRSLISCCAHSGSKFCQTLSFKPGYAVHRGQLLMVLFRPPYGGPGALSADMQLHPRYGQQTGV